MSLNFPDFESIISDALNIRLTQVARKTIKVSTSTSHPDARIIRKTTVISVIEKTGRTSNLHLGGANNG